MFENLLIFTVVLFNLFLSIVIIVWDIYFYFKMKEEERWTKLLYAVVGFLWFIRYALFIFNIPPFGIKDVNPTLLVMITFTLLSLAIASIVRVQKLTEKDEFKHDIIKFVNGGK